MKRQITIILATLLLSLGGINSANAKGYWTGDVNGDDDVTLADVTSLASLIKKGGMASSACDANGDGQVTKEDIAAIVEIILGKRESEWHEGDEQEIPIGGTGSFDVKEELGS